MTAEYVGTFAHDTDEWHAARASGLGSSDIAAVMGLSPYESHFSLWHRKANLVGPPAVSEEMSWGHYLEPAIAARFADEHPELRVRRTGTWRQRGRQWQTANPDRLAYPGKVPVEIKWAPYSDGWGKSGTNEIPIYYRCQVQWQLDVLDREYAYVAALVGAEYREYFIEWDPEDIELLRDAGHDFMDSLAAGTAPDLDATGHTYQVLKELHPDIDDRDEPISDELADDFRTLLADAERAEAEQQLVKNRMLDAMGTARRAVRADGERVALRKPGRGGSIVLTETKPPKPSKTTIKEATQA